MKTRGAYHKAAAQRGCVLECNGGGGGGGGTGGVARKPGESGATRGNAHIFLSRSHKHVYRRNVHFSKGAANIITGADVITVRK